MNNQKPLLSVKMDYIFKLIFGDRRNVDILGAFLSSVLDIPKAEYEELAIVDPHIKMESESDKYGILDVKIHTKSGGIIHVEIQRQVSPELMPRVIYSQSKMVTEQMSSGYEWNVIRRVITILITEAAFIRDGEGYHHQFRYRTNDGMELTDIVEINTLDLSRLPIADDSTELWHWMKFINSSDRKDMEMLTKKSPQMKKAVGILMELSEDERVRMIAEKREWARRDQVALIDGAREEGLAEGVEIGKAEGVEIGKAEGLEIGKAEGLEIGKAEGLEIGKAEGELAKALAIAKNLLDLGMSVAEISDTTKLPIDKIEALKTT